MPVVYQVLAALLVTLGIIWVPVAGYLWLVRLSTVLTDLFGSTGGVIAAWLGLALSSVLSIGLFRLAEHLSRRAMTG
jgi:uncharacterized membrane protein